MKINKIITNNLGLYGGQRLFDFSLSTKNRPIILFGGLNGAGKTTLFDGIRLCLYGREIFKRISDEDYHEYLKEKIHRTEDMLLPPEDALIGLEFEFAENGELNQYYVERYWSISSGALVETLTINKNNEKLEDVNAEFWQDFIKELIPIGVSQLFFFDGEKIQNIISDNNNQEFKNSVKSLLGIDIIERLQSDIKIYQSRNLKKVSSKEEKKKLEKTEYKIDAIDEKIKIINDNKTNVDTAIKKKQDERKRYKAKISAQGGTFLKQKEEMEKRKKNVENHLELVKEKLRFVAAENLPLAIISQLTHRLKDRLQLEETQVISRIASERITEKKTTILGLLKNKHSEFSSLDANIKKKLKAELEAIFKEEEQTIFEEELFGYSSSQIAALIATIDSCPGTIEKLKKHTAEYEKQFRQLQALEKDIAKAPEGELVRPMYDFLAEISETLGQLTTEKAHFEQQITELDQQKAALLAEQSKISQRIFDSEKSDLKLKLTQKTNRVLVQYKQELAKSRIGKLTEQFLQTFNELHRKDDLVSSIEIDPESLRISMYDKKGQEIAIEKLSSGEKEIYAIALLQSLAKTSGMNLPFIIDTPLGRLDTQHRKKLVERFFPNAAHQMIIFSTDTEIGEEYYKILEPNIAKTYKLGYDNVGKKTHVNEGYFWS